MKPLITPQEAISISYHHGTIDTLDIVKNVSEQWGSRYENKQFDYYCMLAAVYTTGYIQGKREVRAKQKKGE